MYEYATQFILHCSSASTPLKTRVSNIFQESQDAISEINKSLTQNIHCGRYTYNDKVNHARVAFILSTWCASILKCLSDNSIQNRSVPFLCCNYRGPRMPPNTFCLFSVTICVYLITFPFCFHWHVQTRKIFLWTELGVMEWIRT